MARPHIEFIQSQWLHWETLPQNANIGPVRCKILSIDQNSGECSLLINFPRGFQHQLPHSLMWQEHYVLEGDLSIDDHDLDADCYVVVPQNKSPLITSDIGAVTLSFFSLQDVSVHDQNVESLPIHVTYTPDIPWSEEGIDPDVQYLRLSHKTLWNHGKDTGERTILLSMGAQTHPPDWQLPQLFHPCIEEAYLLGGDIITERGTMHQGAYFWRPPLIPHGPFGSRMGSLSLIRLTEGTHENLWTDDTVSIDPHRAYNLALPKELRRWVVSDWVPSNAY